MMPDIEARKKRNLYAAGAGFTVLLMLVGAFVWGMAMARNAERQQEVAVAEQSEKKEIAKDAQQLLCREGDKEIYDRELCEYWADVAGEPVIQPQWDGPSRAELVEAFRAYCAEGDNCKGKDGATPTPDDIAAAFGRFCADGRCAGPAGKDGADGAPAEPLAPEYEMVLAAVTEVCATGVCAGPAGKDGLNGADGADGQNATQEMVFAAVQQYCANDACRGPAGPAGADSTVPGPAGEPGATGATGAQGVSIVDVDCVGEGVDSTWQIALSDGQILNGGGPCKTTVGGPPIELGPPA